MNKDKLWQTKLAARLHDPGGVCQERCPLNVHLVSRLFWSRARISLGGLSQTSAMGLQLRIGPLQRWGWLALACYS